MTTDILQLEGQTEARDAVPRSGSVSSCNDLLRLVELEKMNLPKAQCSSGTTQSRPYPTRAVKVMESAGQLTRPNAVAGGGKRAEKHKSAQGAPASIL